MDYKKVLEELYSLDIKKWTLGLDRIESLLKKLSNPEKNLKCIHVTGTNGKGSVCAMLHSVLMDAGYKVGLYTSPHLKKFNERIRINDVLISDMELVDYYLKVKKYVDGQSFFEITTAMAFLYFAEKNVDFVVLEVGMGGRLDATNVVTPMVSVITNVGLEHTEFLGNTIKKIANEKSGIIKEKIPTITAAHGIALAAIKQKANEKHAQLTIIKKNKKEIKKVQDKGIKKNKKALWSYRLIFLYGFLLSICIDLFYIKSISDWDFLIITVLWLLISIVFDFKSSATLKTVLFYFILFTILYIAFQVL